MTSPYDFNAEVHPKDTMTLGRPLSFRFTRYLDTHWSLDEKVGQLEQIDWRMARAMRLHLQGRDIPAIAAALKVKERQAQRLLKAAKEFVLDKVDSDGGYDSRLQYLQVSNPMLFTVYMMRNNGWSRSDVARLVGRSPGHVSDLLRDAEEKVGPWRSKIARKYATALVEVLREGA